MTHGGMGRPLTTLRRYSGIWSTVSGVPWASRRTACLDMGCLLGLLRAEFADHAHYGLDVFDGSAGDDAVAEIEDVAGTALGGAQNVADALLERISGGAKRVMGSRLPCTA